MRHVMTKSAIIQTTEFGLSISGPFPKTSFDKYCGRDGARTMLLQPRGYRTEKKK